MELQQMRYVVAVAETNSFTRAAERCLVVQSALSHQIARLEKELGARLFERTSRRVWLTPAGEAFLPAARQCLDAAERAAAEVAAAVGEVRGRLAVGLIPTVTAVDIPGALRDFRERYPHVRIRLRVGASDDLVEQVKEGAIDVAFLGLPTTARPRGVAAHELARDRLVAVVAPDHPLAGEPEVDLRRLSSEVFVDLPAGTAGRAQSDVAFEAAGLSRDVAFEVTSADFIARLVGPGLAVAMLPRAYAPQLAGVVTIEVADAPARVEYVIWSRFTRTPAATAFLAALDITATES
ncbi:LysR family transcriptional regulator [Streptomyces samsunensis]|uniref:LysR family transcriptional regulator n=1 Tax=Streptomyces TaxID=1883 RepID=UPI000853BDA6|nr:MULTISPECIES: LysR family transcriptional regulator [Streptomyces]MYU16129.1 LysR family transcriptional regulator [Streptomyces sp. SID8361]MCD9589618.1 LysR family transcriptional regulator [Streptomyces sp. 8ZJF_21]MYX60667.1 LysR family transcriptional regulator [Streptomyces sp. SID8382]NUH39283.1 LysR family transcriptional regulator [Streptomyces samsunensis]QDL69952.1 LysR family transcriptional regulator [Streptomyces malaysiensis]